jgi:hypothetical protein
MPVVFFNLQDSNGQIVDQEGVELPDLDAVTAYAIGVARELMHGDELERRIWRLDVFDSDGSLLFEIPFATVDTTLDHLDQRLREVVEQLSETRGNFAETWSDMKRLRLELQAMRARSRHRPYLCAQYGRPLWRPGAGDMKVKKCFERAGACEAMAIKATDLVAKARFAYLAAQWRELAARIERQRAQKPSN